jgi:hypothetical protein
MLLAELVYIICMTGGPVSIRTVVQATIEKEERSEEAGG